MLKVSKGDEFYLVEKAGRVALPESKAKEFTLAFNEATSSQRDFSNLHKHLFAVAEEMGYYVKQNDNLYSFCYQLWFQTLKVEKYLHVFVIAIGRCRKVERDILN